MIGSEDLRRGMRVSAMIQDCCVEGSFHATVEKIVHGRDGYVSAVIFDNGVALTNFMGVEFNEEEA